MKAVEGKSTVTETAEKRIWTPSPETISAWKAENDRYWPVYDAEGYKAAEKIKEACLEILVSAGLSKEEAENLGHVRTITVIKGVVDRSEHTSILDGIQGFSGSDSVSRSTR